MFGELEAALGKIEASLVRFLGEGRATAGSLRAEAERIDQSVRRPLTEVTARVLGAEGKLKGHFARLRGELERFRPPPSP